MIKQVKNSGMQEEGLLSSHSQQVIAAGTGRVTSLCAVIVGRLPLAQMTPHLCMYREK